jgi:hypothetical protein
MLQHAGYKPAFHLVAQNQMDREHPARLYPQAQAHVAKPIGPRSDCVSVKVWEIVLCNDLSGDGVEM